MDGSLSQKNLEDLNSHLDLSTIKLHSQNQSIHLTDQNSMVKNVIGTINNDVIIGNQFDNTIYGQGGKDNIKGNAGSDTIYLYLNSLIHQNQKNRILQNFLDTKIDDEFSKISGNEDHDNYIINLQEENIKNKVSFVLINNYDDIKKLDNLIINDDNYYISSVNFSKITNSITKESFLKINMLDKISNNEYIVLIENWFKSSDYRHLQIQFKNKLTLSESIMSQITEYLNTVNVPLLSDNNTRKYYINLDLNIDDQLQNIELNTFNILGSFNKTNSIKFKIDNYENNNSKLKAARFDNDLYLTFINLKTNQMSHLVIKNYFLIGLMNERKLSIKINDQEILSQKEFFTAISKLDESNIFEILN
jgi:Ca2+-binding RTX toxin-like protein